MKYLFIIFALLLASCAEQEPKEVKWANQKKGYDTVYYVSKGVLKHKLPNGQGGYDYFEKVNLWNAVEKDKGVAANISPLKTKVISKKLIKTESGIYHFVVTDEKDSGWILADWIDFK